MTGPRVRVAGIDPGIGRTGFGIVDWEAGRPRHIYNTCVETRAHSPQPDRLAALHGKIVKLLNKFKPAVAVVEKLYFSKNVKTAMIVGEARGVILMSLAGRGIQIVEQTPQAMKMALTSNGRADKKDVQKMVSILLAVEKCWKVDDEADALALALSYRPNLFEPSRTPRKTGMEAATETGLKTPLPVGEE